MCGICGMVDFVHGRPVEEAILQVMCQAMIHRGPDDEGIFLNGAVGLGVRRLSIIDLEGGHQPVHNEDKTVWVVLNGEIYNFVALRGLLEKLGHRFYTRTDTEVLVHIYEEFGEECVNHLNGMFAFAVWDSVQQKLLIARDRMGIKPLYYTVVAGQLLFASELKALLTHPDVERKLDLVALSEYLTFEYVPTPRSIIKGVRKLPPGHVLRLWKGHVVEVEYWDARFADSESGVPRYRDESEVALREHLREAVRKEMVSDVPIGVLLSGGLDSSSVAAMMAELSPGNVKSFSVGFDDPSFDESHHARRVAEHLGTHHHEMTLTPRMLLDFVPRLADVLDEPLGDSSIIPTTFLSKFARQHVKVALGGDGGDELFAGYPTLQAHRLVELYGQLVPARIRSRLVPRLVAGLPVSFDNISFDFKVRRFISGRGVPLGSRHHIWLGSFTPEEKRMLFQPWLVLDTVDTFDPAYRHLKHTDAQALLNQILYLDMKLYLEGDILFKVDRASMSCSLETRVPLLNHSLVEFVLDLPLHMKLRGLRTKYLLKRSMSPLLPREIIQRPKKGFNIPVARWIGHELKELVLDLLSAERLQRQGLFEFAYVHRLLDEHFTRRRDNRKLLWTLLAFQLWYERYIENAG